MTGELTGKGKFYEQELQKFTKTDEFYISEKTLKTRKLAGKTGHGDRLIRGLTIPHCTKAPKDEIIYCCQLRTALLVIVVSLLNITFTENNTCFVV